MKLQLSIQSSYTQLYEVKWPISLIEMNIYDSSPICLHLIESYSFSFHFLYFLSNTTQILRSDAINFLIKFWQLSFWLWHYTFQYIFVPPFPSQTNFRSKTFSTLFLLEIDIWKALLKKKKSEKIYRHESTCVLRSSKTIDQSFMTNLKIYLQ